MRATVLKSASGSPLSRSLVMCPSSPSAWRHFESQQRKFAYWLSSDSTSMKRQMADAYHTLGIALLEADSDDRPAHLREARRAFEQDYLLSKAYLKPSDTLPALRKLTECFRGECDYPSAIRHCEQALTVAVRTKLVEERQGALVTLGLICLDWLDDNTDSGSSGGLTERRLLTDQMCSYFLRAHTLAEAMRPSLSQGISSEKRRELLRNAKINMAISLHQQVLLLSLQDQESRRQPELEQELSESIAAYVDPSALGKFDLFGLFARRVFNPDPTPPQAARALLDEAKQYCLDAEALCFRDERASAAGQQGKVMEALPPHLDEIDVDDGPPPTNGTKEVHAHSSVRHTMGQLHEASNRMSAALSEYLFALRRLNCLRSIATRDRDEFKAFYEGQYKSLGNAVLVCIKQGRWTFGHKLARQLCVLVERACMRARLDGASQEEVDSDFEESRRIVKERVQMIASCRRLKEQVSAIESELTALDAEPPSAVGLARRYDLHRRKRELIHASINGIQDQNTLEYFGRDFQSRGNCEREMWNIGRQQRALLLSSSGIAVLTADNMTAPIKASLIRECHLLIHVAQGVSAICRLHLPRSPHRDLERSVADKYWRLVRTFHSLVWETLCRSPAHEWTAMTLREQADAFDMLQVSTQTRREFRIEAFRTIERCTPAVMARMASVRLELANSIVESFVEEDAASTSAVLSSAAAQERTTWTNLQAQCERVWAQREATPAGGFWEVNRVAEAYEGEIAWGEATIQAATSVATTATTTTTSAAAASATTPHAAPAADSIFARAAGSTTPTPRSTTPSPSTTTTSTSRNAASSSTASKSAAPVVPRKRRRIREDGSQTEEEEEDEEVQLIQEVIRPRAERATPPARKRQAAPVVDHTAAAAAPAAVEEIPILPIAHAPPQPPAQPQPILGGTSFMPAHLVPAVIPSAITRSVALAAFTWSHAIEHQSAEELVVEVRRLKLDAGAIQRLSLTHDRFSHTASKEMCALFHRSAAPPVAAATVSDHALVAASLSSVHELDLSFSVMEKTSDWSYALLALAKLPRLQTLRLTCTPVGDWCSGHLARAIQKSAMLRVLHLDDCAHLHGSGPPEAANKLVATLTGQRGLEELSLRGCTLAPETLAQLIRACAHLPRLQVLALCYARVMSFQYEYGDTSFTPPTVLEVVEADPTAATLDSLLTRWRERRQQTVVIGPTQLAQLKRVYEAIADIATKTNAEQTQRTGLLTLKVGFHAAHTHECVR